MRKQFAENAYKSYHVYKVINVLHNYSKMLGIRLVGHPANKNKSLILIKFSSIFHTFLCNSQNYHPRGTVVSASGNSLSGHPQHRGANNVTVRF